MGLTLKIDNLIVDMDEVYTLLCKDDFEQVEDCELEDLISTCNALKHMCETVLNSKKLD